MLVSALDPGVRTGVASYDTCTQEFESTELDTWPEVVEWVRGHDRGALVTERFLISSRTIKGKVQYDSLFIEGWLRLEYPNVVCQTPAQAKSLVSDEMLHHLGFYKSSKDKHAADAARHLTYYLVKRRDPKIIDALKSYVA